MGIISFQICSILLEDCDGYVNPAAGATIRLSQKTAFSALRLLSRKFSVQFFTNFNFSSHFAPFPAPHRSPRRQLGHHRGQYSVDALDRSEEQ